MKKKFNVLLLLLVSFIFSEQSYANKKVTIWFIADIGVGLERWVTSDGKYKYYNNRPHWAELRKSISTKIFRDQKSCEIELLQNYSSVWRTGSNKTVVDKRDPNQPFEVLSNMRGVQDEGFFTTKSEDWDNEIIFFKTYYTCGSKSFYLKDIKW